MTVELPPLRERLADLPSLAQHFLDGAAQRHGRPARSLSKEALDLLTRYRWPGNVRELKNVVESMVLLGRDPVLGPETVPVYARESGDRSDPVASLTGRRLDEIERLLVTRTLDDVGGNRERAAKMLGISTRTLYRKINEYGLSAGGRRSRHRGVRDPLEPVTSSPIRRGSPCRNGTVRRGLRETQRPGNMPGPSETNESWRIASSASTSAPRTASSRSWRAASRA